MYLSKLNIWNFRKFGSFEDSTMPGLSIDFQPGLNLLVGENDSGKSCVVEAIKNVIFTHYEWIRVEYNDFHVPPKSENKEDRANFLKIQCIFRGLKDFEAKTFLEWLGFDEQGEYFLKIWLDGIRKETRGFDRDIICEIKAGPDDIGTQISSEARRYLRATYLKPLRDAENELAPKKGSRLSQILYSHQEFEEPDEHYLMEVMKKANEQIQQYFQDSEKSKILETINEEYLKKISSLHEPVRSNLHIAESNLRRILEKLELKVSDNKIPELITLPGLGTNNLLFIATELLLLKKENYPGLKLALIEEIEAHLHPQAQLRLIEFLQEESENSEVQLIMTTHSSNLASKINLNNLIIFKNANAFPMGEDFTKLYYSDYEYLKKFLDSTKANLFFANGVIIVEGIAENLIIPSIAEIIDKPLSKFGVSIVNVGSKALLRYSRIFHRKGSSTMGIPVACVTDRDILPDIAVENELFLKNRKKESDYSDEKLEEELDKIMSKYNGFGVQTFISPVWTLEYDIALGRFGLLMHKSITLAKAVKNKKEGLTDEEFQAVVKKAQEEYEIKKIEYKENKELALFVYTPLLKNQASKAVAAQYFAELLRKEATKEEILSEEYTKYLVDAINYVT